MNNVKGYNALTFWQRDIFDRVYKKHLSAMGMKERQAYTEKHLKEIKMGKDSIHVYFHNGEWFKYYRNGTWA